MQPKHPRDEGKIETMPQASTLPTKNTTKKRQRPTKQNYRQQREERRKGRKTDSIRREAKKVQSRIYLHSTSELKERGTRLHEGQKDREAD